MPTHQPPQLWRPPQWHPDHGDPGIELEHLRSFARNLLSAVPNATVVLEIPEPGLMDVRVELPCETVAEVYSVPSIASRDPVSRRLALFIHPESSQEIEIYAESVEDASNLFALLASPLRDVKRSGSPLAAGTQRFLNERTGPVTVIDADPVRDVGRGPGSRNCGFRQRAERRVGSPARPRIANGSEPRGPARNTRRREETRPAVGSVGRGRVRDGGTRAAGLSGDLRLDTGRISVSIHRSTNIPGART